MKSESPGDDRLQQAWQRLADRHRDDPVNQVHPDEMTRVLTRSGPEAERLRILDRIAQNANAQRDLELLRAAQAIAPAQRSRWARPAMALAAVLIAAVAINQWQDARRARDVERGAGTTAMALIEPAADQRVSARFVWHSVPDVIRYDVEVLDARGGVVWHASTRDSVLAVPDSISLARASIWYVTATTPSGQLSSAIRKLRP